MSTYLLDDDDGPPLRTDPVARPTGEACDSCGVVPTNLECRCNR